MAKKRRKRRHWDDDEKREIVAQTRVPGVSVSRVARRYDVNANLVFKWLRDPRFRPVNEEDEDLAFLPVEVLPDRLHRTSIRLFWTARLRSNFPTDTG